MTCQATRANQHFRGHAQAAAESKRRAPVKTGGANAGLENAVDQRRIALVCDWLTTVGGAERVLLALHEMYPDAPIYTSQYDPKSIDWFKSADVRTGWLQIFPSKLRRFLGPLRQVYFSHLDLSDYDLVISVTGAEAKSVRTKARTASSKPNTNPQKPNEKPENRTSPAKTEHTCRHLCYCHVPTQYYWQFYDDYVKNPGFGVLNPLARIGLKLLIKPLRKKDYAAAKYPDEFITISAYAAEQIKKYYGREATIVHPPVDVEKFSTSAKNLSANNPTKSAKSQTNSDHIFTFITTSRQVTWKRLDLCIKACQKTGGRLVLVGDGPEHGDLKKLAHGSKNIIFHPQTDADTLKSLLQQADAYLFPSLEPFGIAPVEALAAGLPVIAYGKGGSRDYIKPGKNGIFFSSQTANSLADTIETFKTQTFDPGIIKNSAKPFSTAEFKRKMKEIIDGRQQN